MFESYFYDKRALTSNRLFKALKTESGPDFTINRLSKKMGMSYQQTYNAFQDIMHDLEVIGQKPQADMTESDFAKMAKDITTDQYRFYLLRQSVAFLFYCAIFQDNQIDARKFCEQHNISISTLRRRVEPFRNYLLSVRVNLNTSTWQLEGAELQIRAAMVAFFQISYRGNGWPFEHFPQTYVQHELELINDFGEQFVFVPQPAIQKPDLLQLAIQLMRMTQGNVLTPQPRMQLLVHEKAQDLHPLIYTRTNFPALSSTALVAERDYFYFNQMRKFSVADHLTHDDDLIRACLNQTDNIVKRFADGMLPRLYETIQKPTAADLERARVLHTNLLRLGFTFYLHDGICSSQLDFVAKNQLQTADSLLGQIVDAYLQDLPTDAPESVFTSYAPMINLQVYYLAAIDFAEISYNATLKVQVAVESATFLARDLIIFLRDVNFIEIVSDSFPTPDVIVTSFGDLSRVGKLINHPIDDEVTVLYWTAEATDQQFFELYTQLKQLHTQQQLKALPVAKEA